MWKEYIEIFEKSPSSIDDYFNYIQDKFGNLFEIISKNSLLSSIEKANDDLFYQRKNIDGFFYNGGLSEVISIFYHYFKIDWDFLSFKASSLKESLNDSYRQEFNLIQKSNLAKHIFLDMEKILSIKDINQFSYLFMFFMPGVNKKEILFNNKNNRPLICCNSVSIENFYMLQELMLRYETETYESLKTGYNFNHQLIEDYMDKSKKLSGYEENNNWEEELPITKMNVFLSTGCNFTDFDIYRNKKNLVLFPNLYIVLMNFQSSKISEYLEKTLSQKLIKNTNLIKI